MPEQKDQEQRIEVSSSEWQELQKIRILAEAKEDLVSWAKARFTWLAIITALIGLIGTNVLVAAAVRSFLEQDIADAQKASILSQESSNRSKSAMDRATEKAEQYASTIDKLNEKALKIDERFTEVNRQINAQARNIREGTALTLEELQAQLINLEETVSTLAEDAIPERLGDIASFQAEQVKLRDSTKKVQDRFSENSKYTISVISPKDTALKETIVDTVVKEGFVAEQFSSTAEQSLETWKPAPNTQLNKVSILYLEENSAKADQVADIIASIEGVTSVQKVKATDAVSGWIGVFIPE